MLNPKSYRTFLGMQAHFNQKVPYDGWKYNFQTRVSEKTLEANRYQLYPFAKLDEEFPSTIDQIKFFYPSFRRGYVKPKQIQAMRSNHKDFMREIGMAVEKFDKDINSIASQMSSVMELLGLTNGLPNVYLYSQQGGIKDESTSLSLLFLALPELNTVVSQEPIVYERWKSNIDFHKPFVSLYFDSDALNSVKGLIYDALKKLSR